jgi:hypothetical protein
MNAPLLCQWLGLPSQTWPPDPYTLLGLKPGEADSVALEHRVHERMARLRCYQISHPEEATEGMNRLAQAFITLSEACAAVPQTPAATPTMAPPLGPTTSKKRVGDDTAVILRTQVDWRNAPPPVRGGATANGAPSSGAPAKDTTPAPAGSLPGRAAPREDRESLRALAQESLEATGGLGTLAAVAERIDLTRQLLVAWQALGGILGRSNTKKPASPHDRADFPRLLRQIDERMLRFPAFLGQPGKPGYRVVALARLSMTYDMLKQLDARQKADLLRDWDNGEKTLLAHRAFLRQQFKSLRHAGLFGATLRAVRGFLNDYALYVGLGAVVLAMAVLAFMMAW